MSRIARMLSRVSIYQQPKASDRIPSTADGLIFVIDGIRISVSIGASRGPGGLTGLHGGGQFFFGASIRKSSSCLPSLIAMVSHLGFNPLPDHFSPCGPLRRNLMSLSQSASMFDICGRGWTD
jgi:hypothetical protein